MPDVVALVKAVRALNYERVRQAALQELESFVAPDAGVGRVDQLSPVSLDNQVVGFLVGLVIREDRGDLVSCVLERLESLCLVDLKRPRRITLLNQTPHLG